MDNRLVYVFLGLLAFFVRLFFEFQSSIITGINGGYIPIQVMKIYEHGHLAISDMPMVFYLNAVIVKFIAYLFPQYSVEIIVLYVIKITGSLSLPLILVPLYKINHKFIKVKLPKAYEYSVLVFCLFSFSSLYLGAEMMKNTFGLVGFVFLIYFIFQFIYQKSLRYALLMGIFLVFIGLTHFGVFSISIILIIISLFCIYKKRAIIPTLSIMIMGFFIVWMIDSSRAFNAINIFEKWFGLPWRIAYYFPGIVHCLLNLCIVILLIFLLKTKVTEKGHRQILTILLLFMVLLALPILRFELWRRFSFMLFLAQAIALIVAYPYLQSYIKKKVPIALILVCAISLIYNIVLPKKAVISEAAYKDLANISRIIENPNNTLIFAKHGLDWWMIWQLDVKMAQSHLEIDEATIDKYDEILILHQKKGRNRLYPGPYSPFVKPSVPIDSNQVYSSEYFEVFKFSN
ncbi:hypothetical protein [Winogradskyella sp. PE311]|uniref:hypothetical protein n=1 Tax=Winogradskyella sp. PE311 TaxID=3366943 RepID=UPI00397FB9D9